MPLPTPDEKEKFIALLMRLRDFLRTSDDNVARQHAEALVEEIAKDDD